jgi:hypothetical protein
MNASPITSRSPTLRPIAAAPAAPSARLQRRERDFGVGYGSSSGYAGPRRYVTASTQRLFRFA